LPSRIDSGEDFLEGVSPFKWYIHNVFGHPIMAHLQLLGLNNAANWVHDLTLP